MIPIQYNLRNLQVRKTTTAASALGLALVVFVIAGAGMLNNGVKNTLSRSGSDDVAIVMRKGSNAEMESGIDEAEYGPILSGTGAKQGAKGPVGVGELVVVILLDKLGTTGFANVQVRGVQDHVFEFRENAKIVEGRAARAGTDEVVIGKGIRGRFKGVDLGQSFELKKNRNVTVVGVFEDEGSSHESEVWVDINLLRTAFGREGLFSAVRVKLSDPSQFDAYKASLEANRSLKVTALREPEYFEKQSEGVALFLSVMGYTIAFFGSIGAMIGAMITMHASIASRQREIGTLRALGFSRIAIMLAFLLESTLVALIGGGIGVVAALGLGAVKFSTVNMATWSEMVFSFEATPAVMMIAVVCSISMGLLGGFFPAIRAAKIDPITAMRG